MRKDSERLLDILEAIERIAKYAARGRETFERDELIQTWIVHHLEVVGEACRETSPALQQQHPEIEWGDIVGMRNVLAHRYFEIDCGIVWSVVEKDLPELKLNIEAILASPDDET